MQIEGQYDADTYRNELLRVVGFHVHLKSTTTNVCTTEVHGRRAANVDPPLRITQCSFLASGSCKNSIKTRRCTRAAEKIRPNSPTTSTPLLHLPIPHPHTPPNSPPSPLVSTHRLFTLTAKWRPRTRSFRVAPSFVSAINGSRCIPQTQAAWPQRCWGLNAASASSRSTTVCPSGDTVSSTDTSVEETGEESAEKPRRRLLKRMWARIKRCWGLPEFEFEEL